MRISLWPSYCSFMISQQKRLHALPLLCLWLCLCGLLLSSCSVFGSGGGGGSGNASSTKSVTATPAALALTSLHWCGKPLQVFRDEGVPPTSTVTGTATSTATAGTPTATTTVGTGTATATSTTVASGTPTTITDWAQVEPKLGFAVYLPATLPEGTCLTSASGTINDPIFGGSFTIGYLLPDSSSLSLSEAPLRSQNTTFQCSASNSSSSSSGSTKGKATPTTTTGKPLAPLLICTGARDTTNIVFSARGTTETLQAFFNALQTHVNWIPTAS